MRKHQRTFQKRAQNNRQKVNHSYYISRGGIRL